MEYPLPLPVIHILESLKQAGFEAYIVGGCVRDLLLKRVPKDWDITTNAEPEQIQALFPDHVYENTFGTVGVKVKRFHPLTPPQYEYDIIEVTTYRTETGYSDHRRPDQVTFVTTLARRSRSSRLHYQCSCGFSSITMDSLQRTHPKLLSVPSRSLITFDGLG
jgi:hypothetical protein